MGKKAKVGKQRKDHFYALAKQQGFRARSAYKLTQLGNKFNLFDDVSFVIDLCAAPGGWMQVARQSVPMAGHVFGVDLFPIKPIKGCTAIQADITTARCEKLLSEAMDRIGVPNKKADLVLHDGAPNVGSSWDRDAYNQNDLVLKSLHLATKFLKPKGTFVTKVFRSADYTKLLWVFDQLFGQVTPTKPSSSREVSAEIFVVCRNYKAPSKIASALFDVAKVFEQVEESVPTAHGEALNRSDLISKSLLPSVEKSQLRMGGLKAALAGVSKKNRSGYEDGDDFRKCNIRQFFESAMPAHVLVHHHRIEFNKEDAFDVAVYNDESTTESIKECLHDLKLVGKGDLKALLKWRMTYLKKHAEAAPEKIDKRKEEDKGNDLDKLQSLLQQEAKEKLKTLRKQRTRWRKMHDKMRIATAVFDAKDGGEDLFVDPATAAEAWAAEQTLLDVEGADNQNPFDTEDALMTTDDEASDDAEDDATRGDDESDEEDADYISQLESELAELHKLRKEARAAQELKSEAKAKTDTRRRKMYRAWAEEMEEFVSSMATRSKETKLASTDKDEEDEEVSSDEDIPSQLKKLPEERQELMSDDDSESQAAAGEEESGLSGGDNSASEETDAEPEDEAGSESQLEAGAQEAESGADDESASEADEMDVDEEVDSDLGEEPAEESDAELPEIPLSEKKQRQIRRKKDMARKEKKSARRAAKDAKMLSVLGGAVDEEGNPQEILSKTRARVQTVAPNIVSLPRAGGGDLSSSDDDEVDEKQHARPTSLDEMAEIQAIGKQLSKKKSRMDLIDGMYNRFAFSDPAGLPDWFREHDKKVRTFETPMTKEMAAEYRAKLKEISERPIRKVVEARARKRARGDKSQRNKRDKTYIAVSKRGGSKNFEARSGKKSGGHFTNVDRRLKKDKRAVKASSAKKRKSRR